MNYDLKINTTAGIKTGTVSATSMPAESPFGHVQYGQSGTSTLDSTQISAFWALVDQVLSANGLTSADFIRAISATDSNGVLIGEM
jgi:hypothetical protein